MDTLRSFHGGSYDIPKLHKARKLEEICLYTDIRPVPTVFGTLEGLLENWPNLERVCLHLNGARPLELTGNEVVQFG